MTTVRAASSVTLSVALEPRRADPLKVAPREVVHQEVAAREVALREAAHHHVRLREIPAVVAVVPAAMTTTIITHRAAVVEAAEGSLIRDASRHCEEERRSNPGE